MSQIPQRRHYLAVFFVSLSLLMLEITVARILTVALLSHYAFVAISLAMFGLGLSGLVIYLLPHKFPAERVDEQLATYMALFGGTAAVSILAFLQIHVVQELSMAGLVTLGLAYAVLTVPFFLGGVCISLLMTHFSARIASIYYADLVGASIGCLGVVTALNLFTAPQVAVVVAAVVSGTALLVALGSGRGKTLAAASSAVVGALLVLSFTTDLYTMTYIKNRTERYSDKEAWNSFSRISAFPERRNAAQLVPMNRSEAELAGDQYPETMIVDIDGAAWTPMMKYNGDPSTIQFLRDSVLYVAHAMKPAADVCIIGIGGGRDVLAAIAYGQPKILGIEINGAMRHLVQDLYADYAGKPYTAPNVEVIIDEARSRLSGIDSKFDIIQLSLIDTFSLNSAGGFVFSENYLYTVEGFQEYFDHLKDDGILSLTRYFVPQYPVEVLRIAAMARAAWEAEGIKDFSKHIVVLKQGLNTTMLAKKSPYTPEELTKLESEAKRLNSEVLYAPGMKGAGHKDIVTMITTPDPHGYMDGYPFFIDPPTDDRPFFFNFLRGLLPKGTDDPFHFLTMWNDAFLLMYMLIGVVTVMAVVFFFLPLITFGRGQMHKVDTVVAAPLLLYFACLGYGFLMIEIPMLQRFMLLLGSPIYALAVVLFALLFFSGTGSLISERLTANPMRTLTIVLSSILAISIVYVVALPPVIEMFLGTPIAVRIGVTVLLLAPIGLLLGMAYPLGITILRGYGEELVPWAWGLNGAMSVVASVTSIFIGSRIGFTAAFLTGVAAYGVGLASMTIATRLRPAPPR